MSKVHQFSQKRRQMMIAGAVGALAPAGALAVQCGGGLASASEQAFGTDGAGGKLVLSGRVLGFGCQPLAGAVIEVWGSGADAMRTTTDGDGRFVLVTQAPAASRGEAPYLSYQVTHPMHDLRVRELYFTRQSGRATENVAQLERDDSGVWRAAFGLTVA